MRTNAAFNRDDYHAVRKSVSREAALSSQKAMILSIQEPGNCPLCGKRLHVEQGRRGPVWICGCVTIEELT